MSRALLIGLDGATFTVLDPLMASGTMPFLRELTARGVRGPLLSTPNPLTPPAWTSLMTGRTPGHHGVFDFIRAEERGDEVYFTLCDFRDIACETIWSMVNGRGLRAMSLNFPLMFPAPEIQGYVVPGLTSWKHLRRGVRPAHLYDQIRAIPGVEVREMAWDFELEKKAAQVIDRSEYEPWVRFHIRREQHWFEVARHLVTSDPCDLMAVIFDGVDKLQHVCWRFLDPALAHTLESPWEWSIRALCLEYFERLDRYIAELVHLAGEDTRVFLASDHGFGATEEVFRVNTWLSHQGLLTWRDLSGLDERSAESLRRRLNSNFVLLDWQRTRAYARTASSNGLHIRVAGNGMDSGVPPEQLASFRRQLTESLRAFRNPATGHPVVQKVMTREEAFPGPWGHRAPDLTLVLRDHGFVSIANVEPVVERRPEPAGTHRPEGIFIVSGAGVRSGGTVEGLSIVDVTSTLLYSLGLPVPEDLEGRVVLEAFTAEFRDAHTPLSGQPTQARRDVDDGDVPADEAGEAAIVERLKALGYID